MLAEKYFVFLRSCLLMTLFCFILLSGSCLVSLKAGWVLLKNKVQSSFPGLSAESYLQNTQTPVHLRTRWWSSGWLVFSEPCCVQRWWMWEPFRKDLLLKFYVWNTESFTSTVVCPKASRNIWLKMGHTDADISQPLEFVMKI